MFDARTSYKVQNWISRVLFGLLVICGLIGVATQKGEKSAVIALIWLVPVYGFANLISRRAKVVEQFRSSPLWFTVTSLKHWPEGGATLKFDGFAVEKNSKLGYSTEKTYLFDISSGELLPSPGADGKPIDSSLSPWRILLELPPGQLFDLTILCRDYLSAKDRFRTTMVLGWIGAVLLTAFGESPQQLLALVVATCAVVVWGTIPRWTTDDIRRDAGFLHRPHYHLYEFCPSGTEAHSEYVCKCGKSFAAINSECI